MLYHPRMVETTRIVPSRKRIWVATPYGEDGMGGIDRLNDAIFDSMRVHPEFGLDCVRLVTRGKGGLALAQGIFAAAVARFCAAALRKNVDLLHIHLSDRGSVYRKVILGRAARALRVPYVLHLHGVYLQEFWAGSAAVLKRELKQLFTGSEQVIVLGHHWKDVVQQGAPDAQSRISVLPNATPAQPDRQPQRDRGPVRITFLGQLGARKGVPELVTALGRLAHHTDWVATIAGDGDIDATSSQVASEGISERVRIPGWLDGASRTMLLANSDILVLPSHAENLPMVVLEALSHGVAVIATPVGAVPEVIADGHNGLLVPAGDVDSLSRSIERLIVDAGLRNALGAAARKTHADRYEFEAYVRRLAQIWKRACK